MANQTNEFARSLVLLGGIVIVFTGGFLLAWPVGVFIELMFGEGAKDGLAAGIVLVFTFLIGMHLAKELFVWLIRWDHNRQQSTNRVKQ